MFCSCCSVKQQKLWVFATGSTLLVAGLVLIIWGPRIADNILFAELPLSPGSRTFDKWVVTPIPVYLNMYLFNWTNAEQVRTAGVKPNFEQLGPYVYREEKSKENLVWHANKTVTFQSKRVWYFEPEMSNGTLNDLVTCPHLPSIAASHAVRDFPYLIKFFFNMEVNRNGGALYQTHTANEWLFEGFYDQFLDYAMKLNNSMTDNIKYNHFAWFYKRNGSETFEGHFTINTGQQDLRQMGELKFWNGQNQTGFFEGDCGIINGSTSDLFVPNRAEDEYITIFVTDTCRIINLVPTGEKITIEGIEGYKYETKPDTYDNGQLNPHMKCYCATPEQPEQCAKTGATLMETCADGAPMYMSHAHFMYADPSYSETITGLRPDYKRDNFFLIMERKLGIPLQVNVAVQISLRVSPDKHIDILKNIPEFYAPMFVIGSKAIMTSDIAKEVKLALSLPDIFLYSGVALLCLGFLIVIIGLYFVKSKRWENHAKLPIQDTQ